MVALLFRNRDSAAQIFQGWREDLGIDDRDELLRVSIIRGISAAHPAWYRMVIGVEPHAWKAGVKPYEDRVIVVSRINTMEPATSENLERFLGSFAAKKSYVLAPAIVDSHNRLEATGKLTLTKRTIHVREAWQVGQHDLDAPAIHDDDDLVIPDGQEDVPVRELQRRRAREGRKPG
jgi:hypothetical protein